MNIFSRIKNRLVRATGFSTAGLRAAWRHEEAFRFECVLALVMLPLAVWLGDTFLARALLIGCCLLVMLVELLNSAIEAVVDQVTEEYAELAGRAKDLGSAAVMLSMFVTLLVWAGVALDRWWI